MDSKSNSDDDGDGIEWEIDEKLGEIAAHRERRDSVLSKRNSFYHITTGDFATCPSLITDAEEQVPYSEVHSDDNVFQSIPTGFSELSAASFVPLPSPILKPTPSLAPATPVALNPLNGVPGSRKPTVDLPGSTPSQMMFWPPVQGSLGSTPLCNMPLPPDFVAPPWMPTGMQPLGWLPPGSIVPQGYGAILVGMVPNMPMDLRQAPAPPPSRYQRSGQPKGPPERAAPQAGVGKTTIMVQNLPGAYTRDMVVQLLDLHGFNGDYNFLYVPINLRTRENFGYCFVNMVSETAALAAMNSLEGFTAWGVPSDKVCSVSWSGRLQGYQAHIDRYRNSPVMHKNVEDPFKPACFQNGVRIPFPESTQVLKEPRVRKLPA